MAEGSYISGNCQNQFTNQCTTYQVYQKVHTCLSFGRQLQEFESWSTRFQIISILHLFTYSAYTSGQPWFLIQLGSTWITYKVVAYRVNPDIGQAFFGTNMYFLDRKATGYRVNLDIGQVFSQTNVYPISDLSCIASEALSS